MPRPYIPLTENIYSNKKIMTYFFYTSSSHIPLQLVFQSYTFLSNIYEQLKLLNSIVATQNLHFILTCSCYLLHGIKNPKKPKQLLLLSASISYHKMYCIYFFYRHIFGKHEQQITQTWEQIDIYRRGFQHVATLCLIKAYAFPQNTYSV